MGYPRSRGGDWRSRQSELGPWLGPIEALVVFVLGKFRGAHPKRLMCAVKLVESGDRFISRFLKIPLGVTKHG